MNDALSQITVGQVAIVAVVVGALLRFGGRGWAWARRAVHFVDKLEAIERQVHANGGSSLRDAVDRIGQTQAALAQTQAALAQSHAEQTDRLDSLVEEVGSVRSALEQHIVESTRAPRRDDDPPETDFRPVTHH